jgi:hypothetical protein
MQRQDDAVLIANLNELLESSTTAIESVYYLTPWVNSSPRYRERIYCYELYHQLRKRTQESPYVIHGEMDKSGHPYFDDGAAPKPDFIIHKPGTDENCAVIEVKRAQNLSLRAIRKDCRTLEQFSQRYDRLIYLVFGDQNPKKMADRIFAATTFAKDARFELWLHCACGQPAARYSMTMEQRSE